MIRKNFIPNRKNGEEVVVHLRRHWFIFFRMFLLFIFLCLIPIGIYFLLNFSWPNVFSGDIAHPLLVIAGSIYYLMIMLFAFTFWTTTYLDVWTITTERIINREQNALFNRVVSELELYNIQDITAEQKGILPTIFHYGNVYIQSAGEVNRFSFEQIPNPYQIAKTIQKLDEKAKLNHTHEDAGKTV